MSDVTVVGAYALAEQPDSPEYDFGDVTRCTRTFEGAFDVCLAAVPPRGVAMEGSGTLIVINSKVKKMPAGHGRMTVTLEAPGFGSFEGTLNPDNESYEIDWLEVERPLLTHPRYQTDGDSELTDTDRAMIQTWRDGQDPELRKIYQYRTPMGSVSTLAAAAQNYAEKILAGVESYTDYIPLARIKSLKTALPDITPAGGWTSSKPFPQCPGGYVWRKTADRASRAGRSGRWVRDIEWVGFKAIDGDLYDAIGGGS